jgi:hypothetical protein
LLPPGPSKKPAGDAAGKKAWRRFRALPGIVQVAAVFALVVLIGASAALGGSAESAKDPVASKTDVVSPTPGLPASTATQEQPATASKNEAPSGYRVVHVLPSDNGGAKYYILMDPVNLNSSFKADVKAIIRKLVSENGPLYIEFHDSLKSLTVSYEQYGDMSWPMGRVRSDAEDAEQVRHYIAQYTGETDHELDFFPDGAPKGLRSDFNCCETFEP